ncbi:MAG TPA: cysteine synthase A [Candidatus Faecicola pullistercoris]|nr:cysteine synthase A [Candidatus Faecicola pullistercoris]
MGRTADCILELIGHTPLMRLERIESKYGLESRIYAKLECFNPLGSIKDRVAYNMICDARDKGRLKPGALIIEPTSGNTGIGLAYCSAVMGYKLILTMPDTMSVERRRLLKALGAEIVLTPGAKGMTGAIEEAERLNALNPGSVIMGQFDNPANPATHEKTTGPEILLQAEGRIDYFVATVGTGGTFTGVSRALKASLPSVKAVAVEPASSAVLSGKKAGPHGIQGIGAGFVPSVLDVSLIDEIITVEDRTAYEYTAEIARTEGILAGISSGAALAAAIEIAKTKKDKTIVTVFPDSGERYLSTGIFDK